MLSSIIFIAAPVVVLIPLLVFWSTNNRLMALDARCQSAASDVDVHLKHRHNLIPGLVETVRGFSKHEHKVLKELVKARAAAVNAASAMMREKAEAQIGQNIQSVMQLAEKFPELVASNHFRLLQNELIDAENRITASRRFSNLAVQEYNSALHQFPGSLVARVRRLKSRKSFNLGAERKTVDQPLAFEF